MHRRKIIIRFHKARSSQQYFTLWLWVKMNTGTDVIYLIEKCEQLSFLRIFFGSSKYRHAIKSVKSHLVFSRDFRRKWSPIAAVVGDFQIVYAKKKVPAGSLSKADDCLTNHPLPASTSQQKGLRNVTATYTCLSVAIIPQHSNEWTNSICLILVIHPHRRSSESTREQNFSRRTSENEILNDTSPTTRNANNLFRDAGIDGTWK